MKNRKLIVLTIFLIIIGLSSCKKIREELIPTRIEGTVTDAETGEPIPHSTVYLIQFWSTNGGGSKVYGTYYTNEKGEFKIIEKLPRYVDKKGNYKPEFWYKVLGENKTLFYCGKINGKNTTGDSDASTGIKITRKNKVSLKLRKTGLLNIKAIDDPDITHYHPIFEVSDINSNPLTKRFSKDNFNNGVLEFYLLPDIYKLTNGGYLIYPEFEVKYAETYNIILKY
jgi:hypothetical protein